MREGGGQVANKFGTVDRVYKLEFFKPGEKFGS